MNRFISFITVASVLLLAGIGSARTVEVDNYMPAADSYCYNAKMLADYPGDRLFTYRLELLTQAYSTNGRISGLEAGIRARNGGIGCDGIEFVVVPGSLCFLPLQVFYFILG